MMHLALYFVHLACRDHVAFGNLIEASRLAQFGRRLARGDLIVDAGGTLLRGREPGVDQGAERLPLGQLDRLAEMHHRAPPFRPLAFLDCPRWLPCFVVPELKPGDWPAIDHDCLGEHRCRPDPKATVAIFLSVDNEFGECLAVPSDAEHGVFVALVVPVAAWRDLGHAFDARVRRLWWSTVWTMRPAGRCAAER